jgi:putative ABC transport system ATP-binding protein
MSKVVISAKNIQKSYKMSKTNIVQALKGVDLEVKEGDFTAIVGPSGCGKSTLMHIVGMVDRAEGGEIVIDGQDVSTIKERQATKIRAKKIGFIFQGFNLLPTLSALDNVALAGRYGGMSKRKAKEEAAKMLEDMGLKDRLNHLPNELSGGQQQRVAIARALINKPAIILADEPTGELDSKNSIEIIEMLKDLNSKNNQTFLIVTHNLEVARACKQVVELKDGLRIK